MNLFQIYFDFIPIVFWLCEMNKIDGAGNCIYVVI